MARLAGFAGRRWGSSPALPSYLSSLPSLPVLVSNSESCSSWQEGADACPVASRAPAAPGSNPQSRSRPPAGRCLQAEWAPGGLQPTPQPQMGSRGRRLSPHPSELSTWDSQSRPCVRWCAWAPCAASLRDAKIISVSRTPSPWLRAPQALHHFIRACAAGPVTGGTQRPGHW